MVVWCQRQNNWSICQICRQSVAMVIRWTGFLLRDRSDHITRRLVVYTRDTGRMSSSSVSGLACTPLKILIKLNIDNCKNLFTLTLWNISALLSWNLQKYKYMISFSGNYKLFIPQIKH